MTTDTNNTAQASSSKPVEAFFTGSSDEGPKVSLSINANRNSERVPNFSGTVGDQKVNGYIRPGAKGGWIALTGERGTDGMFEQLGSCNIVVNKNGKIRMSLKMTGSTDVIWVSVSDKVPQEMLVQCGLSLEILATKRAEAAANKPA